MSKKLQNIIIGKLSENELKDYATFFKHNNLEKFELEENGVKIKLERKVTFESLPSQTVRPRAIATKSNEGNDLEKEILSKSKEETKAIKSNLKEIKSPIVGTFYSSPSPEADAFVSVGKKIKANDTVGIVEAMKAMNEIKAGISGTVKEILVKNGENVVTDQVIILVE